MSDEGVPLADLPPSPTRLADVEQKLAEYRVTFNLRWEADMRAIRRWQEAHPGNDLVWPDHADLVVWLLGQLNPVEQAWPECGRHSEIQHRDGKPPWCDHCGWNRGRPAIVARHRDDMPNLGSTRRERETGGS